MTTAADLFADAINPAARYRSVLFDPTYEVPADAPAPAFDELMPAFGLELWPLPEFSHDQFLSDRNHYGWLSWQTTRPLDVNSPSGKKATRRWRDADRRARKAAAVPAPRDEVDLAAQLDAEKARDGAAAIRALIDPMTGRNLQ